MYTFEELPQLRTAHTASLQEMKRFESSDRRLFIM